MILLAGVAGKLLTGYEGCCVSFLLEGKAVFPEGDFTGVILLVGNLMTVLARESSSAMVELSKSVSSPQI